MHSAQVNAPHDYVSFAHCKLRTGTDFSKTGQDYDSFHAPAYEGPITRSHSEAGPTIILITESFHPRDPRFGLLGFEEAKHKEIEGLMEKGTWALQLKNEGPVN